MGRPGLDSNEVYAECVKRMEPLKSMVEQARHEAEVLIKVAKDRVDAETLAVVRYGLQNGLSKYAVGRLTGKTRAADRDALVARAMGADWVPEVVRDVETITIDGFEVERAPDAEGYTWVTAPNGVRYAFGQTIEGHTRWYVDGVELDAKQQYDTMTYALEEYAGLNSQKIDRHSED